MHRRTTTLALLLAAMTLAISPRPAAAQTFPSRPVTLVVPFPGGSTTDLVARILADKLSASLGQRVVIENKGGSGGLTAAQGVARSAPDGHVLFMGTIGTHGINPSIFRTLPYDPIRDFTPIIQFGTAPNVLVVSKGVPVGNVRDLVAYAKANPGKLNYGSSGVGTSNHLSSAMFAARADANLVHVPYRGGAQAIQDLIRGEVSMMFYHYLPLLGFVEEGSLKPLAVTSKGRVPALPNVPTMAEAGFPDFEVSAWFGVYGPAGMPRPLVEQLHGEIARIIRDPQMQKTLGEQGIDPVNGSPEDLAELTRSEIARWAKTAADAGIKPE
jgi:tripartite-type tricarboxylate transporter receptor subunit TctC